MKRVRILVLAVGLVLALAGCQTETGDDTGNDIDMMRPDLGFRGIAVGNAAEELRRIREPQIYHATAPHAAGIREGLVHYGWLPAPPGAAAPNGAQSNPAQEAQ